MISGLFIFSCIILGGFLPALIWLWLILKEDRDHPEPRLRLVLSFIAGMGAVLLVIPIQFLIKDFALSTVVTLIFLAAAEEIAKYVMAYISALTSRDVDEPLDEVIYMVTVALGFAALENSLFLARPLLEGNIAKAFLIAHIRFVGSTIVHAASSGIVGMYLAKFYYSKKRFEPVALGLIFAIGLHSTYNLLIMNASTTSVLHAFIGLWFVCFILVLVLNHIKKHLT